MSNDYSINKYKDFFRNKKNFIFNFPVAWESFNISLASVTLSDLGENVLTFLTFCQQLLLSHIIQLHVILLTQDQGVYVASFCHKFPLSPKLILNLCKMRIRYKHLSSRQNF